MAMGGGGRRSRGPGLVNGAVVLALVLVLTTVALTAQQQPPPTVAEFAPQAIDRIEDAPQEQTSAFGEPVGIGDGPPPPTPTPGPTPEPIEVARVRRCVGDPPRQTEDPQSPPCVPYWNGDNGGATARGVTANQINLIQAGGAGEETARIYEAYFNKRFEFYGRRLNIRVLTEEETGGDQFNNCEVQKAVVADLVERYNAFAVTDTANSHTYCFHKELARRGVVSAHTNTLFSEAELASEHPYLWQYISTHEKLFGALGEMSCARLAGRNAVYSSDAVYQRSPRKFGIVLQEPQREGVIDLAPLTRALARCGIRDVVTLRSAQAEGTDQTAFALNAVLRLKQSGVTTVICLCIIFEELNLSIAATNQSYYPEWILSSYLVNDYSLLVKLFWTADHRENIIGLSGQPPNRSGENEPAYNAAVETDPSVDAGGLDQALNTYRTLLMLSSGIQMAGPKLTPETFAAGLQKTRFPNPPSRSGTVGFEEGDHSMTQDFAEFWWSEGTRDPSPYLAQEPGTLCYVDRGTRKMLGAWPQRKDPFYTGACVADPGA